MAMIRKAFFVMLLHMIKYVAMNIISTGIYMINNVIENIMFNGSMRNHTNFRMIHFLSFAYHMRDPGEQTLLPSPTPL